MNLYISLMIITATTVGKIMLCAVVGMLVSRHFSHPETSNKGLSYIAMKVFLPCLLFSNLCLNVTWGQLSKFYCAPLFAFLPMLLGFACSLLVRGFLTPDYRYVVFLGSTFQNGLTFPLSVVLNLKGVSWFTGQAVVDAQSYIFLYNLVCSIGLWAIGEPLIAWAKKKEVEAEEAATHAAAMAREAALNGDPGSLHGSPSYQNRSFSFPFESPRASDVAEEAVHSPLSPAAASAHREATAQEQLGWYRPASRHDRPIAPPEGSPVIVLDGELSITDVAERRPSPNASARTHRILKILFKSLNSPPVLSSLLAIFISLVPPLRWLAESYPGEAVMGGMTLIGKGAIPLQLLVLGLSVVASLPKDMEKPADAPSSSGARGDGGGAAASADPSSSLAEGEGEIMDGTPSPPHPTEEDVNACVAWITSKLSAQFIFTWSTVLLRLVVIPAICIVAVHFLVKAGIMPDERPFMLSMLIGSMSPSAINSSLICAMHGYHAREYSRMIFFMYITTILTSTIWLFIYIVYLERNVE